MASSDSGVLGILGGMGPLATAGFVKSIYLANLADVEQEMPRIIVDCDPGLLPDRSRAIASGSGDELSRLIERRLDRLIEHGATRIVIACVTAHYFLSQVSPVTRDKVISVVSATIKSVACKPGARFLLLATEGTISAGIFQREPAWQGVARQVVLPGPADLALVHELVYQVKRQQLSPSEVLAVIERVRASSRATGLILGCTEFHLYGTELASRYGEDAVADGLGAIAADLPAYLAGDLAPCH